MMNITLTGRLAKEAAIRTIPTQQGELKVVKTTLAVKRSRYNKTKEELETTFINIEAWGKPAEVLAKYTQKGSLIQVSGDLVNNNYTDKEGVKRYEMSFLVDNIELLESKKATEERATSHIMNEQKQQMPEMNRFMVWMIWNRLLIIKIYLKEGENEKVNR
ncbi:single-stranded DNA-binding protein [Enterococcus faecalis]|uniref:single-stranded DNA-binding protein n=1 Tax=Enterococcus faecalis TaxID=1351 RepID=UPI000449A9D9|nr:single-stranded DNA-binding protein [Enterococcus faecalis]ETU00483.1 hypothetical protein P004_02985 [Enterococcus faecalis EnGen0404]ETU12094.1 hypothetical protein P008_02959 [Enterococcus faecalis EnGen0408]